MQTLPENWHVGDTSSLFCEAKITLIPTSDREITRKKNRYKYLLEHSCKKPEKFSKSHQTAYKKNNNISWPS